MLGKCPRALEPGFVVSSAISASALACSSPTYSAQCEDSDILSWSGCRFNETTSAVAVGAGRVALEPTPW
jgi:hypothetical protein